MEMITKLERCLPELAMVCKPYPGALQGLIDLVEGGQWEFGLDDETDAVDVIDSLEVKVVDGHLWMYRHDDEPGWAWDPNTESWITEED